jgi:hypothetical protein
MATAITIPPIKMVTGGCFTMGFHGVIIRMLESRCNWMNGIKMRFHGVIMVLQLDEWDNDGVITG